MYVKVHGQAHKVKNFCMTRKAFYHKEYTCMWSMKVIPVMVYLMIKVNVLVTERQRNESTGDKKC